MKRYGGIIIAFLAATASMGQKDSSDTIFNSYVVNNYRITFYISSWYDSLAANYSNGQADMPGIFTWYGPDGDSIHLDSVAVRYKGNSSYAMAATSVKKPYKVQFDKYRKNQKFFGLSQLNFSNDVMDPSCMREKVAWDIMGKFMVGPRAVFASLTVGDTLVRSIYTQIEEVDEVFLARNFSKKIYNLFKASNDGASFQYRGDTQSVYASEYSLKTNTKADDWSGLIGMLDTFNTVSDSNFVRDAGKCLNLDDCIRDMAFNMVNSNFDSYTGSSRNFYLYEDRKSGKFRFIPWDFNLAFGNYTEGWNILTLDAFNIPNLDIRPLSRRILANDSLKRAYANYLADMISGPASADSVAALAHRWQPLIDSIVKNDTKKFFTYEQFHTCIDSDVVEKIGPNTTKYPGLRSFATERNRNLSAQIAREAPVLNPPAHKTVPVAGLQCISGPMGKNIIVRYSVPVGGAEAVITLHNAKGALTRSVSGGMKTKGTYKTTLDTRDLSSGYYTVSFQAGKTTASTGVLLMKVE